MNSKKRGGAPNVDSVWESHLQADRPCTDRRSKTGPSRLQQVGAEYGPMGEYSNLASTEANCQPTWIAEQCSIVKT
ncbi:MAG TPA: hypothetical protein VFV87_04550 [Pirellulaceae bacterium]|nr:hypothetical protein [Pirellulaceae bacterium]